ncbi:hypothetical protein P43SY_004922 [Pythium insidiosum]|uniref:Interferon-related developmental regulator N-terminal domain-containing protein n=1 Tax=Pythium insidiosum TaxID=114742 RepID=A0AAD5M5E2_PYTIN|nr:hypothetical protein P43SY_004922 [Pythium insidiosum]
MGKKRATGGRKMRHDDYDEDDTTSIASIETGRSIASEDADFYDTYTKSDGEEEDIDQAIEELTERRTTTRVAALEKLYNHVLHYYPADEISDSLIFGGDNEGFYQRSKSVLEPLAKTAKMQKVKSAAMRSLAMICHVCSVEEENADELLDMYTKFLDVKIVASVCASALEAWGILASSLPDEVLAADTFIDKSIVEKLRAMSKDSSKKNSKKDRKVQRSVFRDIHATLANGDSPQVAFVVKGEHLDVSSWKSVIQFEAIKNVLHSGLQEHIKFNNILRHMLDLPEVIEERANDRRDVFDKKSSSRKSRSNELKGERRRKQHMQESFLDDY